MFGFGGREKRRDGARTQDGIGAGGEPTKPLAPGTRRLRMVFRGEVQGVGFRWTARIVADRVGCTGWVRNESDGSVTMELQGTDDQISGWFGGFSGAYSRYPIDYRIDEKDEIEPVEGDGDFEVRFR